jgi:hypothetical protein
MIHKVISISINRGRKNRRKYERKRKKEKNNRNSMGSTRFNCMQLGGDVFVYPKRGREYMEYMFFYEGDPADTDSEENGKNTIF